MATRPSVRATVKWPEWALVVLVALLTLAPWWRNHEYLRSFFDYGLVIGGAGRIDDGQRPYVDFVSPAQAGWYLINYLAEQAGDGTYQAMTRGGAACTVISLAILVWMLSRRWPLSLAAVVAGALVCGTATQHTLWWYNPWGVVLLAVAAWAGAVAPVLRREDWRWHALAAAALCLGGINKINMQLMALLLVWAWAVRAGLTGRAAWSRVGLTLLFHLAWVIVPVLAEMAWTGASLATWWHNVIALPAATRSGMALAGFSPAYLLKPFGDYYGPLLLPQVGLVGLVATVLTVAAILRKTWRESGWWEKILPVGCGVVALLGGVVLLTTNMDIVYIGIAGWLALLIALWLGYELPARGWWFYGTMVAPAVLVGAAAWHSAWSGQRSQFGHSMSPRASYVAGELAGPDFGYLRGTLIPPEMRESLRLMAEWRQALAPERRSRHFYGPGTEWAAHIWPAMRTPGLPISVYRQAGNSDGVAEIIGLSTALINGTIREITVAQVVDFWEERPGTVLQYRFDRQALGPNYSVYSATVDTGVSGTPVWFTRAFGGNADSRYLESEAMIETLQEWRKFLGVTEGRGTMRLTVPSNRLQGEVVVQRPAGSPRIPVAADFTIYAQATATDRFVRWSQRVELPVDQDMIVVPYAIDSSGMPTTFTVEIPPELAGRVAAGWRGPRILHTRLEGPVEPAWFYRSPEATVALDEAALARMLPDAWRPEQAFMRNGRVTEKGIELSAGGEIWLRAKNLVTEFVGQATLAGSWDPDRIPFVRGMWYWGGRLEVYTEMPLRENDHAVDFRAWCAEPGGWLVIAVDPAESAPAVLVRVHKVTQQ